MTQDFQGTPFRPLTPDELSQMQGVRQALLQQPAAQLGETQAVTGEAGAGAAKSVQDTINAQLQQKTLQNEIDKLNFRNKTASDFQNIADQNGGIIPPKIYNSVKTQASGLGIGTGEFDGLFSPLTDPRDINYNTPEAKTSLRAYSTIKSQVQSLLDQYKAIPSDQIGVYGKANVPNLNAQTALQNGDISEYMDQIFHGAPIYMQNNARESQSYIDQVKGMSANLKSLAEQSGGRITEQQLANWQNLLPDPRKDPRYNEKNIQGLDEALKSTFKSPGLDPNYVPKTHSGSQGQPPGVKGNDLLSNLLSGATKDISSDLSGGVQLAANVAGNVANPFSYAADADPTGKLRQILSAKGIVPEKSNANIALDQVLGMGKQYADIAMNPKEQLIQHPVNTALAVLGPILGATRMAGGFGEAAAGVEGGAEAGAETAATPKMPGKLQQILNPQGTKDVGSQIRDTAVNVAQKNGAVIPGNNIISSMSEWEKTAKAANPGQSSKVADVMNGLLENYADKNITPQDAVKIYHEIDSGFSNRGIQKETVQASSDMALRDALSKELEKVAPGWTKGTGAIAKGFQAEKSPLGQIKKNLPSNAVKAGLNGVANLAGLGLLKDIIGL